MTNHKLPNPTADYNRGSIGKTLDLVPGNRFPESNHIEVIRIAYLLWLIIEIKLNKIRKMLFKRLTWQAWEHIIGQNIERRNARSVFVTHRAVRFANANGRGAFQIEKVLIGSGCYTSHGSHGYDLGFRYCLRWRSGLGSAAGVHQENGRC